MKFATKPIWHRPPHLRHVVTIPWKLKIQISADIQLTWKKMQPYCILIASNFLIRPQILIFSVLKNVASFPILIANKIFTSLFFWLFTFAINLWHPKFVRADVTAVFINSQHGIQRRGQDFLKKFVFEGVHSKEVGRWISWEMLDKAWC